MQVDLIPNNPPFFGPSIWTAPGASQAAWDAMLWVAESAPATRAMRLREIAEFTALGSRYKVDALADILEDEWLG